MTAELYRRVWDIPGYADYSPGEHLAFEFADVAKPDSKIIDFGCGSGKGTKLIQEVTGQDVVGLDWASNAPKVSGVEFMVHDLVNPSPVTAKYGYCTDVMEHIAPEMVDTVLLNIVTAARNVYFAISTVPDIFGAMVGEPLHLTVESHSWWRKKLEEHGCKILWEREATGAAYFYVTAYANGDDFTAVSGLNTAADKLAENVRDNLRLGLQEVCPHAVQDTPVMLLAGGPSLTDFEDEIIKRGKAGEIIVTVNGTYNWLLERGVKPAAQVLVDARGFNKRFLEPVVDSCKYLLSSQCDNAVVSSLPPEQTWLWHSGDTELVKNIHEEHAKEVGHDHQWYPVYGGTTVVLRALPLLAMLGFRKIEVFGWDSCLRGKEHHAYSQPENDGGRIVDVILGGRTFQCHPWMIVQANEVGRVVRYILGHIPDLEIAVRGDGLVSHIFEHAAMLAAKQE